MNQLLLASLVNRDVLLENKAKNLVAQANSMNVCPAVRKPVYACTHADDLFLMTLINFIHFNFIYSQTCLLGT